MTLKLDELLAVAKGYETAATTQIDQKLFMDACRRLKVAVETLYFNKRIGIHESKDGPPNCHGCTVCASEQALQKIGAPSGLRSEDGGSDG